MGLVEGGGSPGGDGMGGNRASSRGGASTSCAGPGALARGCTPQGGSSGQDSNPGPATPACTLLTPTPRTLSCGGQLDTKGNAFLYLELQAGSGREQRMTSALYLQPMFRHCCHLVSVFLPHVGLCASARRWEEPEASISEFLICDFPGPEKMRPSTILWGTPPPRTLELPPSLGSKRSCRHCSVFTSEMGLTGTAQHLTCQLGPSSQF